MPQRKLKRKEEKKFGEPRYGLSRGCQLLAAIMLLFISAQFVHCATSPKSNNKIIPIRSFKHDDSCFTQGLEIHGDILYESCGLNGKSSIRMVNLQTGEVIRQTKLERKYFAEGITVHGGRIYMLTWKNKIMLVFDAHTLMLLGTLPYTTFNGQGWGLTSDGQHLIASDGSDRLTFFAIPTSKELNSIGNKSKGNYVGDKSAENNKQAAALVIVKELVIKHPITKEPITQINELEYVDGFIYANLWYQDEILQINSSTGEVTHRFDMSQLYPKSTRRPNADCLNGIAYNKVDETFLLTGKLWHKYYYVNFSSTATSHDGANNGKHDL